MPATEPMTAVDLRPPYWVFIGGAALAGTAGFVNALLVVCSFHVPVSHMSGAVTTIGIDIAQGELENLRRILGIVVGFLGGAMVSGMIVGGSSLVLGRRYGVALICEGLCFSIAASLLAEPASGWAVSLGLGLAATGCGVQNGMASSYLGLVLRTTHVTGIVTDIGLLLGLRLRGHPISWWKVGLLAALLVGFASGGWGGAIAYSRVGVNGLWIAALGTIIAGAIYLSWRVRRQYRR